MNTLFLKIDGFSGESQDDQHRGWTDVDSYLWGTKRKGDWGAGKTQYHNLTVRCQVDKITPAALLYSSNGNRIKSVTLSACKAGGTQIEYYRVTLENVIVMEVLFRDNGATTDVEYEFQADRVKFQYWEQSAVGGKGPENRMGWDIKNSVSCF